MKIFANIKTYKIIVIYLALACYLLTISVIYINYIQKHKINQPQLTSDLFKYPTKIDKSLIFIGGYGRSGTTLMRAIIDVHPQVSCGPETKILPSFIDYINRFKLSRPNAADMKNAHLRTETLDEAASLFVYHIMKFHIKVVERPCAKDPNILYFMEYLHQLFPNAKFVYMVRDGRAAAFSTMKYMREQRTAKVFKLYMRAWDNFNRNVYSQCAVVGAAFCLMVKYEDLVLQPQRTIRLVAQFLNLNWTDQFMQHEKHINSAIVVSKTEWSTVQIKQAIYTNALTNWVGNIHYDKHQVLTYASMLEVFNYTINFTNVNDGVDLQPNGSFFDSNQDKRLLHINKIKELLRQQIINSYIHK